MRHGPARSEAASAGPPLDVDPGGLAPPRTASPSRDSGRGTRRAAPARSTARWSSWIAERVRGGVAAFQPDLVRPLALESDEEIRIHGDPTLLVGVDLHHPTLDPVGIELWI